MLWTLFQLMLLTTNGFKCELFDGHLSFSRNCLETIFVINDAGEAWHHPTQRPSRYRKIDSHILKQQKALFRYKQCDRLLRLPRV